MKWIYNQLFGKWKILKFNRQLLPDGDVLTWLGIAFLFARIDNSEYRERSWANWCCCCCCCCCCGLTRFLCGEDVDASGPGGWVADIIQEEDWKFGSAGFPDIGEENRRTGEEFMQAKKYESWYDHDLTCIVT